MSQLVRDNGIGTSTGYERLHETTAVLAAQAPGLHGALLAAKAADYDYVLLDGTLIETDRVSTPGPTPGVDLWWSAKHKNHGGNIQVVCAPDGWPIWASPVRPGREHDTTCLRMHPGLLDTLAAVRGDLRTQTDLGYEGEADTVVVAFKKPKNGEGWHVPAERSGGERLGEGYQCCGVDSASGPVSARRTGRRRCPGTAGRPRDPTTTLGLLWTRCRTVLTTARCLPNRSN